jgi:hypothetical protein
MFKSEVEAAIEARLRERRKSILNRNAIDALFGTFSDPVGALGQVFIGRGEAIDFEKLWWSHFIQRTLMSKVAVEQISMKSCPGRLFL